MQAKEKIPSAIKAINADLDLGFDVGHSSVGWAVLQQSPAGVKPVSKKTTSDNLSINILGCGAVIFRADDCLASSRRSYRRQRRQIRSTKHHVARLKVLLKNL